jgi:hypothetical protein
LKYNIPVRLAQLRKKQIDLLHKIREEGIPAPYDCIYPTELSKFIRGDENSPKADVILDMCDKILTGWEGNAKNKTI